MESRAEPTPARGAASPGEPVVPGPRPSPRGSLLLGFSVVGLVIVVLSSLSTLITEIPLTAEFGLLQLLPWTYWVGLSLMGLPVFLAARGGRSGFFAATGALFFAVFAGTPALFEPNAPIWDAYVHLAEAQKIGLIGGIPADLFAYSANWPGFFLTVWMSSAAMGGAALELLVLFPFLTSALTFLALFIFLRSLFGPTTATVGSALGALLNVWAQFHLSPQSIGLVLALLVLATIWRRSTPFRITASLLFVGLVVSHPTSTILILGILVLDVALRYGLRLIRSTRRSSAEQEKGFAYSPALPYGVAWVAWLFFLATGSSQTAETVILAEMGRILQVPEQALNLATARSLESVLVLAPQIRLASLASFAVIGLVALIVLTRNRDSRSVSQFLWAALVSLVLFSLADILFFGGALYDRGLMLFALLTPAIGVAGLAALRLRRPVRQAILAVFLLISVASASTIYSQEAFYFVSDRSAAVSEFLEHVEPEAVVFDGFFPVPVWLDVESRAQYSSIGFFTVHPRALEEFGTTSVVYAVFDGTAEIWYRQWRGIDVLRFYVDAQVRYSNIYDNGGTTIYLVSEPEPMG